MKKDRLRFPDYIRVIACVFVIVIHVSGSTPWYSLDVQSKEWGTLMWYNALARSAVPLFVMLSGMFLLNPKKHCSAIYLKKKILHLITIYIVWSGFYAVFWALQNISNLGMHSDFEKVKLIVKCALESKYHLWFLPMIIGLYVITPCLRKIVESKIIMQYFLLLFAVFAILRPCIMLFVKNEIVASIINRMPLEVAIGYSGYFVLGYYLFEFSLNKWLKRVCFALSAVFVILSGAGSIYISRQENIPQGFMTGEFSMASFLVAASIFIFMKEHISNKDKEKDSIWDKIVGIIAENSLGIYLIHIFWIELYERLGGSVNKFMPIVGVPSVTILILILSGVSCYLLRKIRLLRILFL